MSFAAPHFSRSSASRLSASARTQSLRIEAFRAAACLPRSRSFGSASRKEKEKPPFAYKPFLQHEYSAALSTEWVRCDDLSKSIKVLDGPEGRKYTRISDEAISELSKRACLQSNHLFRSTHLALVTKICKDPEASENDVFVAKSLLENAVTSAKMILPSCQDTGTVIIMGKRGNNVITSDRDEELLSRGVYDAYDQGNLRYSQVAPESMFQEKNTKTNLPAQIDIFAKPGNEYQFLFVVKGGGSANKTSLFQQTKSTLNAAAFSEFIAEKILLIGTAACPPYHLSIVVGGQSAEQNLKMVKLASAKYLDDLPHTGSETGRAFRDIVWENEVLRIGRDLGIGAQFGGKYFLHDVRVIRLPRHGASCPIGVGVSCSADRQVLAKMTPEGVFIEKLETNPQVFLDEANEYIEARNRTSFYTKEQITGAEKVVKLDLNCPMDESCARLSKFEIKTRVEMTGTLVVARDIAHARMLGRMQKKGELPHYMKEFPVYYAGPAKVPKGMCTGSFGPTTSSRMDPYVDKFQEVGGSRIMVGKGNRSSVVTDACKKYGGFYLGSIGGMAASLSQQCIKGVEVLDMEELGMEAVWKIQVEKFPAFLLVDDKGNDFFRAFSVNDVYIPTEINSSIYSVLGWFESFDINMDMILQPDELSVGFGIPIEKAEELVLKYDLENFGGLTIDEFIKMVLSEDGDMLTIHGKSVRSMMEF